MTTCGRPTIEGFTTFIRDVMGIPTEALPDGSTAIVLAFDVAVEIVNLQIQQVSQLMYNLAVYNLGGDNLINWAPDPSPAYPYPVKNPDGLGYFTFLRKQFGVYDFVGGIVTTASDQGTAGGIMVSETLKNLTLADLAHLKTPYGRAYLGIAQSVGTNWGIS